MLTDRQIMILNLIIKDFIDTGLPVGSRTISKKSLIKVSPATIRNDMADLEELGYIVQPHVSAGRVPSEQGLRFYVDSLNKTYDKFNKIINLKKKETSKFLRDATKLLSDMTGMVAIITEPRFSFYRIYNLKLIKLSKRKILFVIVTNNEIVKTFTLDGVDASQSDLDNISQIILDEFYMSSVDEITIKKISKLSYFYPNYNMFFDYFIPFIRKCMDDLSEENIYTYGRDNLFNFSNNIENATNVSNFLKDETNIESLLESDNIKTHVRIGAEIENEEFSSCSIVQSTYEYSSGYRAKIAVIGPIRMDYEEVMEIVESFSKSLSSIYMGIHL